jgi:malate dehydrogenase (oxaloacetate-decarboxylating)
MLKDSNSSLFPSFEQIREISKELAFAVGKAAQEEGVAAVIDDEELRHRIKMNFWNPVYPMFKRKRR